MDIISRKKKVRGGHRSFVTKVIAQIEENKEDVLKLKQLETSLKGKIYVIERLDSEILELISELEDDNDEECSEEIEDSGNFKDRINYALIQIEDLIQKIEQNDFSRQPVFTRRNSQESMSSLGSTAFSNSNDKKQRVKLPKMEIRKFSGRAQDWQEFWDSYKSAVHENEELNDIDKFNYLKHFLEESARKVISGLELTEANYQTAVKLLEKRFAKPDIIKNAHLNAIIKAQAVFNERNVGRLRELFDLVENHHRGLQALKVDESSYSSILVAVVMDKIPGPVRLNMIRGSENHTEWRMSEMLEALGKELDLREQHVSLFGGNNPSGEREKPELKTRPGARGPTTGSALFVKQDGGKRNCLFCDGEHGEASCKAVEDPEERKKLIIKQGRCFICLYKGHRAFKCRNKVACKLCKSTKHHISLCSGSNVDVSSQVPSAPPISASNATSCVESIGYGGRGILQTAQAIALGIKDLKVRVLLDTGSHKTFVTRKVVRELQVGPKRVEPLGIKTFGSKEVDEEMREVVELELISVNRENKVKVEAYVVDSISDVNNEHIEIVKRDYPHLSSIWFSDVCALQDTMEIDVLIGIDHLWDIQEDEAIRGEPGQPVAVRTKFGWVLSGPLKGKNVNTVTQANVSLILDSSPTASTLSKKQKIEEDVHKIWNLETLGIVRGDEVYEDLLDTVKFSGERYSVTLPWKMGHKPLPTNYNNSLCRLRSQMNKLKKNPSILEACNNIIKEQEQAGIIEKVVNLEKADKIHYLPHQTVVRNEAETTKVRMVFDASSRDKKSVASLNSCIHVGPPLNPLLFDIMVRFREHPIAMVADIEKAFLNVEVDPKDRDCLRFLWISDANASEQPIEVYRFNRVVFGVNCSPFLLNAVLRYHLNKYAEEDPAFTAKMSSSFYVDDLISGVTDVDSGVQLYEKAKSRMKEGGFNLRKWKTNNLELESKIEHGEGQKPRSLETKLDTSDESYAKEMLGKDDDKKGKTKVLGTTWDIAADKFEFDLTKFGALGEQEIITKRTILSMLAKLFDPLGLVSPITVAAKVLFQELCTKNLGWDEEIPQQQKEKWKKLVCDLNSVGGITLPRCLYKVDPSKIKNRYLHGFADASKRAYCAVVYLVYETDEQTFSMLICAKTRVAPLKELSIPRLELMSARILASLMDIVYKALSPQVKIDGCRYWLDSKTALYWINNTGLWRQFVQHRVNEILGLSSMDSWGHCAGVCNPADLGSRGVSASTLRDSRLWWEGPHWLFLGRNHWPNSDIALLENSQEVGEEMKSTATMLVNIENNTMGISRVIDIKRFTSLGKLLRSTCWVLRFINNLKNRKQQGECDTRTLGAEEIINAETLWIQETQKELKNAVKFKLLSQQLGVYEENRILRCKGRLDHADLEYDAKHPIILPREHYMTELVILDCHKRVHHNGLAYTLSELRSKFWVTKGRQRVKAIIKKCKVCTRVQGKAYSAPAVAALPDFRVQTVPPFTNVGVDFAGPLYFKTKEAKMEKCYIVLYSCCTSRAIHLDLVEDLSGPTFMRSLRRFTARRGTPSVINSDNAKTFKFTAKFLKKLENDSSFLTFLREKRIVWKFNLERSPWWGGYFERMVGGVKRCLRKVLGKAKLTFDELNTLLIEIEGTLNNRPLTYVYDDVHIQPLTPSHLLHGRRLDHIGIGASLDISAKENNQVNHSKRFWYLVQKLNHFVSRWRKEYLLDLREHEKNKGNKEAEAKKGDVVLIFEDNKKRSEWKMGKIEELIPGKDGIIRGAKVRTCGKGEYEFLNRPLQKLYPLEVSCMETGMERKNDVGECEETRMLSEEDPGGRAKRIAAKDSEWKTRLMLDSC